MTPTSCTSWHSRRCMQWHPFEALSAERLSSMLTDPDRSTDMGPHGKARSASVAGSDAGL